MHTKTKKMSLMHKFIIIILIISLSMSNFLNIAVYATSAILDNQTKVTTNKNVKFDTYFNEGNGDTHYLICDVNTTNENMKMSLSVQTGYLKYAQIEIKDANYNIVNILDAEKRVQSAENNKIELKQINAGENIELGISIKSTAKETMSLSDISKDSKAILTGIYVNGEGKEIEIEKEIVLNVSWKFANETEISSELVKYINFIKDGKEKVLVQILTKTGLKESVNKLPIKESNINVTIPTLGGIEPEEIIVIAKNTLGTNGKEEGIAEISAENIKTDTENRIISVKIENKENNGLVWNGKGQDELLFTYIYNKEDIKEILTTISSKISAEIINYSENKSNAELLGKYDLSKAKGNVVSLEAMTETTELNKGRIYANIASTEKQYETIYNVSALVGISYKDMATEIKVEEIDTYFVDEKGNKYVLENSKELYSYYKTTTISKTNFEKILGENGEIKILDANGNVITVINNTLEADANGNYVINYASKFGKLSFTTTKPIAEGELLISSEKAIIPNLPYTKAQAISFKRIVSKLQIIQKENNKEIVLENKEISIPLTETNTNANIVLSADVLSTIVENKDVEIKIELDNSRENTDLYKNGTFKIEFPEYIEDVVVNTANILYTEGIIAKQVNKQVENGKIVLYVFLGGAQERFSTGSVTNGTNIILNVDIKTKLLTPTASGTIKMYYNHDNACSYTRVDEQTGNGYNETKVNFIAPSGMLAVSRISGYDETGRSIISVNQGTVIDKIQMDSDAKNATMELMLINNTGDTCNTVNVIGRIPFEGNKKIGTDEDLNTTVNTNMIQGIIVQGEESKYAKIYYSSNGEATENLTDSNNGWTLTPADFSTIKSYMIVFENYEFKQGEKIDMFYNFLVPEMIDLNNSLFGTFGVQYEKASEVGTHEESVSADVVGLTTGKGPVMKIEQKVSVGEDGVIQEGQIIKYTITVKNAGTNNIENLKIKDLLPEYSVYAEYQAPGSLQGTEGKYIYPATNTDSETGRQYIEWDIGTVLPDETVTKEIFVKVNKLPTILEYYENEENLRYDDEKEQYYIEGIDEATGELTQTVINSIPEIKICNTLILSATDLERKVSKSSENKVEKVYFVVDEKSSSAPSIILREKEELTYTITVKNNTENTIKNVQVEKLIPEGVDYVEAVATKYNSETGENEQIAKANYNSNDRLMKISIPSLGVDEIATVKVKVLTSELGNSVYDKKINTSSSIYADGINKHITTEVTNTVAKPHLVVEQTDNNGGEYISEGDKITFTLKIKNEGKISTDIMKVVDKISDRFKFVEASYIVNNGTSSTITANDNELLVKPNLEAGAEFILKLTVVANELLNSENEITAENLFTVTGDYIGEINSNIIKKTIEQSTRPNNPDNDNKPSSGDTNNDKEESTDNSDNTNKPDEIKTYKIKGITWLDENSNGARDNGEKLFSGIKVILINATTGDIIIDRTTGKAKETLTAEDGTYEFDNLVQGEYIAVFYHNNSIYGVTEYTKSGVNTELNSDVIVTTVKENGKDVIVAVTNTLKIDTKSISGIDMGLVINKTADLSLNKYVSQITVQNKEGVKTYNYKDTNFAKLDIRAKYLEGSVVVVEYSMVVKNEGNLPAYAKQIVDYMPADFKFNSDLNSNWYVGNDGNLYSTELANTIINPGESKTIKLILTKTMTENNTILSNNRAEIYEQYNELGLADIDSTPNNQAQNEDDIGTANVLISVATGAEVTYTCTLLVGLVMFATGIYFIKRKTARYYN